MTTGDLSTTFALPIDVPAGSDLCTLDDVREFLQEPTADTQQNAIITGLINRASATIMRWTAREFAPRTDNALRTFTYTGGNRLDLTHACIVTVAIWLKRDVSAFSRTFNLDEQRTERPDALPSAVARMLAQYRTPVLA
jgi:hypothetical protein